MKSAATTPHLHTSLFLVTGNQSTSSMSLTFDFPDWKVGIGGCNPVEHQSRLHGQDDEWQADLQVTGHTACICAVHICRCSIHPNAHRIFPGMMMKRRTALVVGQTQSSTNTRSSKPMTLQPGLQSARGWMQVTLASTEATLLYQGFWN